MAQKKAVMIKVEDLDMTDPAAQKQLADKMYTELFGGAPPAFTEEDMAWAKAEFDKQMIENQERLK